MKRAFCFVMLILAGAVPAQEQSYDIVIRGGRVLDGAGNPWVRADVAIKGGRIVEVGMVRQRGKREIDAAGRFVAPGFIDMMDHSGEVLLKNGAAENKLRMGVTTVIAGEGGTPVPAAELGSYFSRLERQGIGVNFGTYYSSGQARVKVMGDKAGRPSSAQMNAIKSEVQTALRAGAFGVSSALIYPPDSFQTTEELIEVAKLAGQCGGYYASHIRDESSKLLEGVNEAIEIGEKSGAKVEIFHLKAAYAPLWGTLMPKAVAAISAARSRGVDVAADVYPYNAGGTGLDITIPSHVFAEGQEAGWKKLRNPETRTQLKRELAAGSKGGWSNLVEASGGWKGVVLANGFSPEYLRFHGKNFVEIGAALGKDPADAAWDILLAALPNRAMALYFMMDQKDIELALRQSWTSVGSDAAASEVFGQTDALGLPHPRAYGTFPRILSHYHRQRSILTLEEAVRKMTSWPAQRMGLSTRGLLREGLSADIVIFDPDKIEDGATWEKPLAAPSGIDVVIVNGAIALEAGKLTGAKAGRVLRHDCGPPSGRDVQARM